MDLLHREASRADPAVPGEDASAMTHIVAIGEASSSLGLVATLVMSITLDKLLEPEQETTTLLLVIANGFSVYTVTFSVLEFYYVKTLLGARGRAATRRASCRRRTPAGSLQRPSN